MNWFHLMISLKKWLENAVRNNIEISESSMKSCHEWRNALKSWAKLPSINLPWKNHENSKIVPVTTPDIEQSPILWFLVTFWNALATLHGSPRLTWKKIILKLCKSPNPTQPKSKPKSRLTCLDYSQPPPQSFRTQLLILSYLMGSRQ